MSKDDPDTDRKRLYELLKRRLGDDQDPEERVKVLAELGVDDTPTPLRQRQICLWAPILRANPKSLAGLTLSQRYEIIATLSEKTKGERFTAGDIAGLVDWLITEGESVSRARAIVTKVMDRTEDAVKKAHQRFGTIKPK
jgi:hypothetical protein